MPSIEITQQEIVEWYDGIVEAIVQTAPAGPWSYFSLMAWDLSRDLDVAALLPLTPKWRNILLKTLRAEPDAPEVWTKFGEHREELFAGYRGDVQVFLRNRRGGQILAQQQMGFEAVRGFLGKGIEACLIPSTSTFWISELNK